jgi:predicted O-methyltransferase YrrM
MLHRAASASSLMLRHGPRAVLLAREAKNRGAMQKKAELRPFISFLRRHPLQTIVEIGTYSGGTLWLWCQIASPTAHVVSIDLPGGAFGGGQNEAQAEQFRSFARDGQRLTLIRADSHDRQTLDELARELGRVSIDFLFIDGDHTYEGVKQDYEMYSPLVRTGGIVAFHDVLPHTQDERCQVDVLWEELKPRAVQHFEFTEAAMSQGERQWGGIGAILVN